MKLKTICKLAVVFALPLSLLSCGDDKKDADSSGSTPDEASAKGHVAIGEKVSGAMEKLIASMSSIKDVESAKAFAEVADEQKAVLTGLLEEAKKLDPPTDEEKAAIQELKDATDAKGDKAQEAMQQGIGQSADAQEIGTIMMSAMLNPEMKAAMDGLKELYGLSD